MKKYAWFSMSVLALMGFLKIFSIIPFNRMSADDFAYGSTVFSQGFWKAQLSWYLSWSGRFTSTFLQTFFGAYSSNSGNSSLFSIITLSLLFFALLSFFRSFLNLKLKNVYLYILSSMALVSL